jgi:hypothetical protein
VQQLTFLFSFSFLFGVEQNCILIQHVHRGECVGTEEAQREYKEEAYSFIIVVLFGSLPSHPSARTGKLFSRHILSVSKGSEHRLNRELDLQSIFGLYVHCAELYSTPSPIIPPAFGLIYEGAIGQPRYRRHFFVAPWQRATPTMIVYLGGGGGVLEPKRRHKKTVGFFIYFYYGGW